METLRVALKNVFRTPRRSVLNILALTVGVSVLIVCLGWIGGYHTYIYETLIKMETGHVQVLRAGYYAEKRRLPVDIVVPDYATVLAAVEALPDVEAAAGRTSFSVKVSAGAKSVRLIGTAVDAEREGAVGILDDQIVRGVFVDQRPGVMLGRPLAEKLGVDAGDTLFLSALDRYQVENLIDAEVVGIFSFGYPLLDENVVYCDLATANRLLSLDDEVTRIVVRLKDGDRLTAGLAAVADEVARYGRTAGEGDGTILEARPWHDFARATVSAVKGDINGFIIMVVIIGILIILGILNSMSMTVHERTREIGTLRAIGMRRGQLLWMLAVESAWLAVIAIGISLVVTMPVALYLGRTGVDIASHMPPEIPIPFGERFHADFAPWHYFFSIGVGLLTAVVGAIVPARRAIGVEVAQAMRGKRFG